MARIYKFIACKLHNSSFVSVAERKLGTLSTDDEWDDDDE